jgi:NAD(P)-dependent dehydrogenase (short-subunit alcohol dehydrogenase family)
MRQQVAVVTGVSRAQGIGFEVGRQLAAHPMTVILTAREQAKAAALADVLVKEGLDVTARQLDVTDQTSINRLVAEMTERFGAIDILINNAAGIAPFGEQAATADLEVAHAVLETTLFGTWRVCQAFLPLLRASGRGRIVNVSSGAGSHGDPAFGLTTANGMGTSYAVAKAAVNALTVKLAIEEKAKGSGVRINAVCPGFTATFDGGAAMGARPVSEGAASVVWAALLGPDGPTGGFFRDGKPLPW